MKKIIIVIVAIVVLAAGAYEYVASQKKVEVQVFACTMDAKMCPDGSYVGRQGPKCEFAACPEAKGVEIKVSL